MEKSKKLFKVLRKDLSKRLNLVVPPEMLQNSIKLQLVELFQKNLLHVKSECVEASTSPFPHCIVHEFLHSDNAPATQFIAELREELLQLEFHPKSNDLYKFVQTSELMAKRSAPGSDESGYHLQNFVSLMRKTMLPYLRDVTGVALNDDIDMFCAQYSSTDCLLCHDDQLEHRCFAYVFYLTPDWSEHDGGSLDLFDSKPASNQSEIFVPDKVVKSIVPAANSLVFFEVSPKSFHQVSEIISESKTRVSLTGWFHGHTSPRVPRKPTPSPPLIRYTPATEDSLLMKWINPSYFNLASQGSIQEQFTKESEIQLNDFLLMEKYEEMDQSLSHLQTLKSCWIACGPANKCRYHKLTPSLLSPDHSEDNPSRSSCNGSSYEEDGKENCTSPGDGCGEDTRNALKVIKELIELFTSEEMFVFLSNITGLSFHPMAVDSDADSDSDSDEVKPSKRRKAAPAGTDSGCRFQLRKWEKGSYTLLSDTDSERGEFALDINLFFKAADWSVDYGGCTSYIATDEDEELLTVLPAGNCLSLAYRDEDALRFVKHINHTAIAVNR